MTLNHSHRIARLAGALGSPLGGFGPTVETDTRGLPYRGSHPRLPPPPSLRRARRPWSTRVTTYPKDEAMAVIRALDKRARKASKRVRDRDRCAWGQLERQQLRGVL